MSAPAQVASATRGEAAAVAGTDLEPAPDYVDSALPADTQTRGAL